MLHTTYERPKRWFSRYIRRMKHWKRENKCFWVTQKGQKEKKHASERLRKGKKRKNMLLSDSERANGEKTRFWVSQKGQMEKKHASEWLRKSKWRKNTLLSNSERVKREKTSFWVTQKEQKAAKGHGWILFFKAWGKNHVAGYHSLWSLVLIKRWYRLFIATFSFCLQQTNIFLAVIFGIIKEVKRMKAYFFMILL